MKDYLIFVGAASLYGWNKKRFHLKNWVLVGSSSTICSHSFLSFILCTYNIKKKTKRRIRNIPQSYMYSKTLLLLPFFHGIFNHPPYRQNPLSLVLNKKKIRASNISWRMFCGFYKEYLNMTKYKNNKKKLFFLFFLVNLSLKKNI